MFSLTRKLLPKNLILNKNLKLESKFHLIANNLNNIQPSLSSSSSNNLPTNVQNTKKSVVNPLKHEDFFELNDLVNMEELFK